MATILGTSGADNIRPVASGGVSAGVTGGAPSDAADTIFAGGANDFISGGGNDDIYGEGGDDYMPGDAGADTIRGGDGYDVIEYASGPMDQGVRVDAPDGTVLDPFGGLDLFPDRDVESFRGTAYADTMIGDGPIGTNRLNIRPGAGSDLILSTSNDVE
jgi:Ca2+-binding RTX toxin-like protein